MRRVSFLLFLPLACGLLMADEGETTVTAKGIAVGELPDVKDEALNDALRKAVEQGVGVVVTSRSEVRDFQLVYEQILTEARGYVRRYTVKSEGWEGERRYYVEIEAVVSTAEIKSDWVALKFILKQKGNPTFLVAVVDRVDGRTERDSSVAEMEIAGFMLEKDIEMVNKRISDEALKKEKEAARVAGDKDKLVALAKRFAADMVLIGVVEAVHEKTKKVYGAVQRTWYNVTYSLQAVRSDDGFIVASLSKTISLDGDGCAEGRREAAMKALKNGAKRAAEEALSLIIKKWQKELLTGAPVTLLVKNTSYADAKRLRERIKKIRFTTVHRPMEFSSKVATIYLRTPFTAERFLEKMIALKIITDDAVSDLARNKITLDMSTK